ncbi:lantibiotic dehydratase C-terminal domain-containing protein [Streptomyces sp. NPDC005251]|uniref:lantibiotic dehydratase C-terminal domain-containing protein n=1 Tax=Streptomyces sp. NPDC005251 TaxID=3157166 RepID=UPI0033B9F8E3
MVARWATGLRRERLGSRLVFDAYAPETGRYGPGAALRSAGAVFTATRPAPSLPCRAWAYTASTHARWAQPVTDPWGRACSSWDGAANHTRTAEQMRTICPRRLHGWVPSERMR